VSRALGAALALLVLAAPAGAAGPLAVGAVAPATTLVDAHGETVRLADLLAKRDWVVVAFYVKAFTGG